MYGILTVLGRGKGVGAHNACVLQESSVLSFHHQQQPLSGQTCLLAGPHTPLSWHFLTPWPVLLGSLKCYLPSV